jgi:hypothetical protein
MDHPTERHTVTPTPTPFDDPRIEQIETAVELAKDILSRQVDEIERSRDEQPARLAKARSEADEARGWALIEEPFESQVTSIPAHEGTTALAIPNLIAKELWGARLCFDLLDCGDDYDQIDAVMSRLFTTVNGDTGLAFLIAASALSTIANLVVPELLQEIEHNASNYHERVKLAEARAKAWHGRVDEIRRQEAHAGDDPEPFDPEVDPW